MSTSSDIPATAPNVSTDPEKQIESQGGDESVSKASTDEAPKNTEKSTPTVGEKRNAEALETSTSSTPTPSEANPSGPTQPPAKRLKSAAETKGLPTREYLDQTVVPILLEALAGLAKERPSDPIDYLVTYLQTHKHEHSSPTNGLVEWTLLQCCPYKSV